jgi:tetratricopeptide (TPR) repeat protein
MPGDRRVESLEIFKICQNPLAGMGRPVEKRFGNCMRKTRLAVFADLVAMIAVLGLTTACNRPAGVSKQDYLKRGNEYAAKGQFGEATIEFLNALKQDPNYGEAEVALGDAYHELGNHQGAATSYARAADLLPNDKDVQLRAGTMRLLARSYLDAKTLAERVIASDPKNIVALVLRANALAGLDELETAVSQVEAAIELDPKRAELYTNLGTIQAAGSKLAEAEAAFKRAIEIAPSDSRTYSALGNFYWASNRPFEAEKQFLKAVDLKADDKLANRTLATFYLASAKPELAERFLKAVAADDKDVGASLRLADFYIVNGKKTEGVTLLKELAKRRDGYAPATSRLAAVQYTEGQKEDARRMIDEVVSRDKTFAPAILVQARFALIENKPAEAMAKAQAAAKANPRLEGAHYLIAQLYKASGNLPDAISSLKTVLQLNSRAAGAQMDLAELQAASGKMDIAIALANSAVSSTRGAPDMRLKLIRLLLSQGDVQRADAELAQLRLQYKPNASVLAASGSLAALKKDATTARRYFDGALALEPGNLDAVSGLIALDLMGGHPDLARKRAEAELAKAPRQPGVLLLTARTYGATGDPGRAESTLKETINLDPSNTDAYGMLAQLLYQQGRLEEGRKEFGKIAEQQPKNVAALTMLAVIANRLGNADEAIRRYEQILAIDPEAAMAANNLAYMYMEQNRSLDRAVELATMAQKRLPEDAAVADTLGFIYVKKNLAQVGLRFLLLAVKLAPTEPVYGYHLGLAYIQLKDQEKAIAALEQSLNYGSKFPEADAARNLLASLKKGKN